MKTKFINFLLLWMCCFSLTEHESTKEVTQPVNIEQISKEKSNQIVTNIFETKTGKTVAEIENISGNNPTSKVFKVTTEDNQVYALKVINSEANSNEIPNQELASAYGFGPEVLQTGEGFIEELDAHNPWKKYSYSITEFLLNEEITTEEIHDPKLYKSLADLLKRIHSSPVEEITKMRRIFNHFDVSFERLETRGNISKSGAEMHARIKGFVKKAKSALELLGSEKTLTHGDLNRKNIIYSNGNFTAIDFDNLAIGDPYDDIVYIIAYYCIYPIFNDSLPIEAALKNQKILLQSYFNRDLTDIEQKKLNIMIKLVLLLRSTLDSELYEFTPCENNQFIYSPDCKDLQMKVSFNLVNAILNEKNLEAEFDYNEIEQYRILYFGINRK